MLRDFVERIGAMTCSRVAWFESETAPDGCECPACGAIECLQTIEVMGEIYSAPEKRPGCLDGTIIGQA